jgi:hypothetical protein
MRPESKLVSQVRKILTTPVPAVRASEFTFNPTEAASNHNLAIIERNWFHYTKIMRAQQGSTAWYGIEFCSWKLLIISNR